MRTLLTALLALTACAGSQTAMTTAPAVAPRDDCPKGWMLQSNPHGSACARPGQEVGPDCQPARCAVTGYLMWDCPEPVRQPEGAPTLVSLGYDNVREGAPGAGVTFALSPPISAEFPHGADRFMAVIYLMTTCGNQRMYMTMFPSPQPPAVDINEKKVRGQVSEVGFNFSPFPEGTPIRGLWLHGYFMRMTLPADCTLAAGTSLLTVALKGAQDRECTACSTMARQ